MNIHLPGVSGTFLHDHLSSLSRGYRPQVASSTVNEKLLTANLLIRKVETRNVPKGCDETSSALEKRNNPVNITIFGDLLY